MKRTISMAMVMAVALLTGPAIAGHDDDDDSSERATACERTAESMFRSCRFEINEEYYATIAKCINLGEADARRDCRDQAQDNRLEERESCGAQREAREGACEILGEGRYDPEALLDGDNFVAEPDDSNPYFNLEPGHTYVARAGEGFEETIVVTVTDEVREVLGVNCRLVVDIVLLAEDGEYEAVEVTDDYYAQALNGDVHYCGEVARNYENGALVNLDGSFEAGRNGAKSGILIKADPVAGFAHRQEYLPGEAEDLIRYVAGVSTPTSVGPGEGGENMNFICNGQCVKTEEFIPPDPEAGEYKYFLPGIGFVLGVSLTDTMPNGERDEVQCIGNSLKVLSDPACGIDDATELLDRLCELSPTAFCVD